jgi:ubiquitin
MLVLIVGIVYADNPATTTTTTGQELVTNRRTHGTPSTECRSRVMDKEIYDEPSEVKAQDGKVKVDGPDGVDIMLTPEAAAETSDRLLYGAAQARGQQIAEEKRNGPRQAGPPLA